MAFLSFRIKIIILKSLFVTTKICLLKFQPIKPQKSFIQISFKNFLIQKGFQRIFFKIFKALRSILSIPGSFHYEQVLYLFFRVPFLFHHVLFDRMQLGNSVTSLFLLISFLHSHVQQKEEFCLKIFVQPMKAQEKFEQNCQEIQAVSDGKQTIQ